MMDRLEQAWRILRQNLGDTDDDARNLILLDLAHSLRQRVALVEPQIELDDVSEREAQP